MIISPLTAAPTTQNEAKITAFLTTLQLQQRIR